jgi:hypothetical protein
MKNSAASRNETHQSRPSPMIEAVLHRARFLAGRGDDTAARRAYLRALHLDPQHPAALTELGALAHQAGFFSAAREAYRQAVRCNPTYAIARVGYGDLLAEAGEFESACDQFRAALALESAMPRAHQGLARALLALGQDAPRHWQQGFAGHAITTRRYRGNAPAIPILLLVSARGGNIPTRHWIDDRIFAVTAIYADFLDPTAALPPHTLIVNAIGDAELCDSALAGAEQIVARSIAPVINPPALIRRTGRQSIAKLVAGIPGLIAPHVTPLSQADRPYPMLLRARGYHTGQHLLRVENEAEVAAATASLPDPDPLAIQYLDARGSDGMVRKYRVMFIDGIAYPLHLAISADWKVHYFTAAMAESPAFRTEERHFLEAMPAVLGPRAMAALSAIQTALGLHYAGIDFGLAPDGTMLLFETNANMVINPPDPGPIWDYRRPAVTAALDAARRMLTSRAGAPA